MLAVERIQEVTVPAAVTNTSKVGIEAPAGAPEFVKKTTMPIISGFGDLLPVSAMPLDGTFPVGTSKYEKRNIAPEIPVWEPDICIQCNQCSFVCPHATIRIKIYDAAYTASAPQTFKSTEAKGREFSGMRYTVQVAPEDCTGCGVCVEVCPAFEKVNGQKTDKKAINMMPQAPLREPEAKNWDHFLNIPDFDPKKFNHFTVKGSQLLPPMFEFSGACAGCGETPYIKLVSQLYGDHTVIANATGCSSIYSGNLPTTPYTTRADGRGPAWSNSLFEDNAEFGLGMRLTINKLTQFAYELLDHMIEIMPEQKALLTAIRDADQSTPEGIEEQRARVDQLKRLLQPNGGDNMLKNRMLAVADNLIKKSVWIFGGDGWAYDIGYGGLDHVLASGQNVNVLVLDTAVYSNTGGQMSKATPRAAVAKFAAAGKSQPKKDLGLIAISYGNVYVAQIAMGANMTQTVQAIREAEAYNGPSLIIAYSHCIMQGIDMVKGNAIQAEAVDSGFWPLYRYNPDVPEGKNPFTLDSKGINIEELELFLYKQTRFNILRKADPDRAHDLYDLIHRDVLQRWSQYQALASAR
jgi:pyruvate-ferredoxin/flavodoxin oxidoreductase